MNVTSGIGDIEYERRRDDKATEDCPYKVKKMLGDELYIECGYDGEHRLCVEEYDPANPCAIHLGEEREELSTVDKAMVDLKALLGKGLFPAAIGDVRRILVRLYEVSVDEGEEDARETVGLWYEPKPW